MKAGTYQANARVVVQHRVAAIYARSASTEQSSQAIKRQMKRCRRYAQEKGWDVIGVFHETGSGP
jgi:site-specific DNA recombinase